MAGPRRRRYEGNWKNGRKHGKGTYTYAGGGQFVGEVRLGPGSQIPLCGSNCTGIWLGEGRGALSTMCQQPHTRAIPRLLPSRVAREPRVAPWLGCEAGAFDAGVTDEKSKTVTGGGGGRRRDAAWVAGALSVLQRRRRCCCSRDPACLAPSPPRRRRRRILLKPLSG